MTELDEILRLALCAPTGDNMQPFSFVKDGNDLVVHFSAERATAMLDVGDVASRLALGALLESLEIVAAARGMETNVTFLDDRVRWARVSFSPAPVVVDPLVSAIEARCTNRAAFDGSLLSASELMALQGHEEPGARAEIFGTRSQVDELSEIVGDAEYVRAQLRIAHEDLQRTLRWSAREAERTRDGLDVRTLGLSTMERIALRFVRPWWRMRIGIFFGAVRMQRTYAKKLARGSSAFAWFGVDALTDESFVAAGRLMQRVWLEATRLGLSVSPFAAYPLISLGVQRGAVPLSDRQRRCLERAAARERSLRAGRPGTCAILLRIGRAPQPHVRSLRLALASEGTAHE